MSQPAGLFRSDLAFSTGNGEWETPQDFFDKLNAEFHFDLDVCATPQNAKCATYFTREQDGLRMPWAPHRAFCNPPYGDPEQPCKRICTKKRCVKRGHHTSVYIPGIIDWMAKSRREAQQGALVVCLVPSRTDTRWWHREIMGHAEIRFVEGRLRFGGAGHNNPAPFPSAVVIYRPPAGGTQPACRL